MELPQGQTGSVGTSVASAEQVRPYLNVNPEKFVCLKINPKSHCGLPLFFSCHLLAH